ncbi:hypothetical protein [Streptosporangium sp. NPDC051022]|uniref:hypothetical protein n=1 Tax=Streptosporangium sp. NPDC051022 TaxID=3155752 RepID=UPI00342589AE
MNAEDFMEQGCYGCGCDHVCEVPEQCHYYCPGHLAEFDQDAAEIAKQWAARWN